MRYTAGDVSRSGLFAGMIRRLLVPILLVWGLSTAWAGEGETVRFGVSWQDYTSPEAGVNLRGELILPKPAFLTASLPDALAPAPFAGLSAHIGQGTSFLYAGALWTIPLTDRLFVEASLAVAANNGRSEPRQGSAAMGCHGGFREEAGLGWRIDPAWSAIVMVEHYSNANLCNHNRGLTNLGLMVGRTF